MRTLTILALLAALALPLWAADTVVGYRGDGSGVFADAKPPTACNAQTGENIRWRVPVANWGYGSPIVVDGKVIVMSEPGWTHDFPLAQCFDVETGKLLWERDLDHFALLKLPDAETARLRGVWTATMQWYRDVYEAAYWWNTGKKDEAKARFAACGCAGPADSGVAGDGGFNYALKAIKPGAEALPKKAAADLAKAGFIGETWRHGLGLGDGIGCIGHTYATPVSDGKRIYIATGFDTFFCLDLDGKVLWQARVPGMNRGDFCNRARSPILHGDLLICDGNALVRAFDKTTGALKWSAKQDMAYQTIVSPVVIRVGDADVLLSGGKDDVGGTAGLYAYRLPDGTPLTIDGWANCGGTMLVKSDARDTIFVTGGGEHGGWEKKGGSATPPPAAVRFALEGDALKATVLWSGIEGVGMAGHAGLLYHDGKLYHAGVILDPATGKIAVGKATRVGSVSRADTACSQVLDIFSPCPPRPVTCVLLRTLYHASKG